MYDDCNDSRIRVYVAGAYSNSNIMEVFNNMRKGMRVGSQLLQMGFSPFVPWLDYQLQLMLQGEETLTVDDFYEYSLSWLRVSDVVLVIPGWEDSKGTLREIEEAENLRIPIKYSLKKLIDYYNDRLIRTLPVTW